MSRNYHTRYQTGKDNEKNELSHARVGDLSVPKTSFERIWWRRSVFDSVGGLGSARTSLVRTFDDTKKQPNDMSPSRICEQWRLFRRQNVRNDDAVRQLAEFARSDPWLDPSTLVESIRSVARDRRWHKCSTATHGDVEIRRFRVTHPYHPLFQQEFELVSYRQDWGEDRVWFQDKLGRLHSLPTSWTDAGAVAIAQQIPRRFVPRKCSQKLSGGPRCGGVSGHRKMHQTSTVMAENHERDRSWNVMVGTTKKSKETRSLV